MKIPNHNQCIDNANNTGWSPSFNFTMEAPPNVTLVSPNTGNRTTSSSMDLSQIIIVISELSIY